MGTSKSRRQKIEYMREQIEQFFQRHPKDSISRSALTAKFVLDNNSTARTAHEILSVLASANLINIDGDLITRWKEK